MCVLSCPVVRAQEVGAPFPIGSPERNFGVGFLSGLMGGLARYPYDGLLAQRYADLRTSQGQGQGRHHAWTMPLTVPARSSRSSSSSSGSGSGSGSGSSAAAESSLFSFVGDGLGQKRHFLLRMSSVSLYRMLYFGLYDTLTQVPQAAEEATVNQQLLAASIASAAAATAASASDTSSSLQDPEMELEQPLLQSKPKQQPKPNVSQSQTPLQQAISVRRAARNEAFEAHASVPLSYRCAAALAASSLAFLVATPFDLVRQNAEARFNSAEYSAASAAAAATAEAGEAAAAASQPGRFATFTANLSSAFSRALQQHGGASGLFLKEGLRRLPLAVIAPASSLLLYDYARSQLITGESRWIVGTLF